MPNLDLNKRREERAKDNNLGVIIGDKTYLIPLGNALKVKELKKLKNEDDFMKFFEEYLPKEVLDTLTVDDFKAIAEAWSAETEKASGVKSGES